MNRILALTTLAVLGLAFALPGTQAETTNPLPSAPDDKCAPPCGYIYPTIGIEADLKKEALRTSQIGGLPESVPIAITYSWNMDQDGTGLPGNADPMRVTVVVAKEPLWLDATLVPRADDPCEFQIVPLVSSYEVCTLDMTLKVDPTQLPHTEEDMDVVFKRLMLFGTSDESGMFKKSYGVEDLRWTFDAPPTVDGMATPDTTTEESPAGAVLAVAAPVGLALLAARRRRA